MPEVLKTIAEYFGWTAPFGYAALAYGFFYWVDKELSDEAKAALARTMRLKDYKKEQVASALVEAFDRIYTYPLLGRRALLRSLLFTTVVSAIYLFEVVRPAIMPVWHFRTAGLAWSALSLAFLDRLLLFNALSDYLSLFVIRPLLIRTGTKPVISLILGAVSGVAIVLAINSLRGVLLGWSLFFESPHVVPTSFHELEFAWPGLAVFVWLPLFALGIVAARLLTPLSWIVGRTQWFLKEGKEHPLKAIG